MNLIDLDILDSEQVEQDNPFINITIDGEEIKAIRLDYLYSLSNEVISGDKKNKLEDIKYKGESENP